MAFDIEGARREGYSESEIADYLGKQRKFDVSGARKEGYSDAEIISHLTGQAAQQPQTTNDQDKSAEKSSFLRRAGGDTAVSALKGAIGLPEAFVGLADIPTGGRVGKALESVGYKPGEAKEYLDTLYSPEQQEANRKVREAEGFTETLKAAVKNPSTIAHSVIESLPLMGGGAGLARGALRIAPKIGAVVAGAGGEGLMSAGSAAEQIRQESPTGTITAKQSAIAAGSGAGTGALGVIGGKIAQRLGIADIDTLLASGVKTETKKNILRRVAESALSEGMLEELPQSAQEQAAQNIAQGKPWDEGVANAAATGMLAGITMGAIGGGFGASSSTGKNARSIRISVQEGMHKNLDDNALAEVIQSATELVHKRPHDKRLAVALNELQNEAAIRLQKQGATPDVENLTPDVETPDIRFAGRGDALAGSLPTHEELKARAAANELNVADILNMKEDIPAADPDERNKIILETIAAKPLGGPSSYQPSYEEMEMMERGRENVSMDELEEHFRIQNEPLAPEPEIRTGKVPSASEIVQPGGNTSVQPGSPVNTEVTYTAVKGDKVFPNVRANNVQALKDMGFTVTENRREVSPEQEVSPKAETPDFNEMVAEAARWKGAAIKADTRYDQNDNKARLAHSKMTTKGDLDAYLMKKYGIDSSTARSVSNELTDKNIKADETANVEDYAGEPWADKALAYGDKETRQSSAIEGQKSAIEGQIQNPDLTVSGQQKPLPGHEGAAYTVNRRRPDVIPDTYRVVITTNEGGRLAIDGTGMSAQEAYDRARAEFERKIAEREGAKQGGKLDETKGSIPPYTSEKKSSKVKVTPDKRQSAIDKYIDHAKTYTNEEGAKAQADKWVKAIDEKDYKTLRNIMNGINPKVNRLFTALTGLPAKTQKQADASLRSFDPEGWDKWQNEKADKRKKEATEREAVDKQRRIDDLLNKRVSYKSEATTYRELFQRLVNEEGYDVIEEQKRGATSNYNLVNNAEGKVVSIPKKILIDYVQGLIDQKKPVQKSELPEASDADLDHLFGKTKEAAKPAQAEDLTKKSTSELVGMGLDIINKYLGERGSFSVKEKVVDESLYQQLKPVLAEIARRAKAKALDVKAYLFGAVDAVPEGQAKELWELCSEKYIAESLNKIEDERKIEEKEAAKEGKNEHSANGSDSQGTLEGDKSGDLSADGRGQGTRSGKRGGSETDVIGDEGIDVDREDGAGSLAGEPGTIHLPDKREDSGELSAGSPEVTEEPTPASEPRTIKLSGDNPGNYRITEADNIGAGTRGQKIEANLAAIRLVKQLEKEQRYPTREEQAILAKYVGWGGLKNVFDEFSTKPQDQKARAELKELLTKNEFHEAFLSIRNAHYTSPEIISSIYDVLRHMGFKGGNVLEPTYGVGNFIGMMPEDLSASSKWYGSELDPITAKIGQFLYPECQLLESGFQVAEFPFGKFDLAIGNPPFGEEQITDNKRKALNRMKIHNYVISKEALHLKPGGILANVVTTRFLDTANPEARDFLAKNFKFLGAIRLPNDAFAKNAGTTVTTDIIFLQRLMPDENPDLNADWLQTGATMENSSGEMITLNKYFAQHPYMMLGEPSMKGTMWGGGWKEGGKGEFTLDKREGQDTGKLVEEVISTHMADLKDIFNQRADDKADAAAIELTVNREDVGIGGFYQEGSDIFRRIDDDEYGNPQFEKLTPETKWTEKTDLGQKRYDRIKGMLNLRAKTYNLIEAERFDRNNIEELRADLNKTYDAFVKEHGFLSENANFALMSDDIKIEFGLESGFKKAITPARAKALGIKPSPAVAQKADILKKRLFYPKKEIIFAKNVTDGYAISLSEKGRLDVDYIASLTGKTTDEVIAELSELNLAFQDPETGKWIQEDEYLSGNVKKKHKIALEKGMGKNAEALEKVFPPDKPAERIYANLGATWIPKAVYEQFAEFIGVQNAVFLISAETGKVAITGGEVRQNDINVAWVNEDYGIADIFNAVAGNKSLVAYDGRGEDRTINKERTKALRPICKGMKETFNDWVFADEERSKLIVKEYNEKQNTHAKRKYDGKKLQMVGNSPGVTLRNTQKNAAWRMVQSPVVLLDHTVGAGKTFTIITGVMERCRMGLTKKAMIVVPNHLVGQWAADWMKLYPGANILAATNKDFTKANRRRLFSRIATGSYDAVIVGHSSFGFVPTENETTIDLIQEEIAQLERAQRQAQAAEDKRTVRNLALRIVKKQERIKALMNKPKDNVIPFEGLGIDHIVVDESHEFKNLEYSSAMQNITGMGTPTGAKKSFDLYAKIRWLMRQPSHAVTFATGTPISNSLVEMYAILRYLNRQGLVDRGLEAFDSWAGTYASTESRIEYTAAQKLKERVVMATFKNVAELLQLYEEFADTVTMEDLKKAFTEQIQEENRKYGTNKREEFPIPKVENGGRQLDLGDPTEAQIEYMDYLVARAQRLEELGGENDPTVDNHLWVMSDARKMALDIRLVDPEAPADPNNKINRSARKIKQIYDKWNVDRGTQLVFCDLSTPLASAKKAGEGFIKKALKTAQMEKDPPTLGALSGMKSLQDQWKYLKHKMEQEVEAIENDPQGETDAYRKRREELEKFIEEATDEIVADLTTSDTGFSVYDDLKATLIRMGIPAGEVRFIHEASTAAQKQELFDLVNSGAVRVLIGSSKKMGAGMNAQERLVALHHLDAPWKPSDVEQREGRIVRQGNILYERDPENFQVRLEAYSTERTFDAVMWQILARKQGMLDDFRNGKDEIEDKADDAGSYADFMASSTGNPIFREKFQLEGQIEELSATERRINVRRASAGSGIDRRANLRKREQETLTDLKEISSKLKDTETFTYRGKEYSADLKDIVAEERRRISTANQEAQDSFESSEEYQKIFNEAKEYQDAHPEKSYVEIGIYFEDKLTEAGLKRPSKKHFDRARFAKQQGPDSAMAAANQIFESVSMLSKEDSETLSFHLGAVKIEIEKSPHPSDERDTLYTILMDGLPIQETRVFDFDSLVDRLTAAVQRKAVQKAITTSEENLVNYDAWDQQDRRTLEKLQFTDKEKLEAMKKRYDEVVEIVNALEQAMAEKRAVSSNKYILNDRVRFGADYAPSPGQPVRREMAVPQRPQRSFGKEDLATLRTIVGEEWDNEADGAEYSAWLARRARAEAILANHGEGNIDDAQYTLDDAKNAWEAANDYPDNPQYPEEILLAQKIITGIRNGQQPLFNDSIALSLYSRGTTTVSTSQLSKEDLEAYANELMSGAKNRPLLKVVEKPEDLPFEAPNDAEGVFHRGVMYLVRGNIASAKDATRVLLHEFVGHFGLSGFFGKSLNPALDFIFAHNPLVQQYSIEWRRGNRDLQRQYGMSNSEYRYRSIEEAMARLAQEGKPYNGAKRLVATLQALLRKIGLDNLANKLEAKTNAEALTMLNNANMYIKYGTTIDSKLPEPLYPFFERAQTATDERPESRAAQRVRGAVARDWEVEESFFGEAPRYDTMSMKEQEEKSLQLIREDWERAKRIAFGEERAPAGLEASNIYRHVANEAIMTGDFQTVQRLSGEDSVISKMLTKAGQTIKASDVTIEGDPIRAIKEIQQFRQDLKERTGADMVPKEELEALQKKLAETEKAFEEYKKKRQEQGAEKAVDEMLPKKKERPQRERFGTRNTLISVERHENNRKALRSELGLISANPMFNPKVHQLLIEEALFYLEGGIRSLPEFTDAMKEYGEKVKPYLKEAWENAKEQYGKATIEKYSQKIENVLNQGGDLSEIGRYANELAKAFIAGGTQDRNTLVAQVQNVLREFMPEISREETMDAISGYGKYTPPTRDEVLRKLHDLRRQIQEERKLMDIYRGQAPQKTGKGRPEPSDEERRLIKQVNEAMRKFGIQTRDKESQLRSALDAVKTRLENQIKDLEEQIRTKEKIVKTKTGVVYDAEATALLHKRDSLKKEFNTIFGKPGMSDEQRARLAEKYLLKAIKGLDQAMQDVRAGKNPYQEGQVKREPISNERLDALRAERLQKMAKLKEYRDEPQKLAALRDNIKELSRKIRENDIAPVKNNAFETPTVAIFRKQRDALRKEIMTLRQLANPKKTPEQIALQTYKTRLKSEAKKLEAQLNALDFTGRPKRETILDEEGKRLKAERDWAKQAYNAAAAKNGEVTQEEAQNIVALSKAMMDARAKWDGKSDMPEYGAAKVAFDRYTEQLKGGNTPIGKMLKDRFAEARKDYRDNPAKAVGSLALDTIKTIADNSISIVASLDNSFLGRQGIKTLMTHPTAWWPAAVKSFDDIVKTLGGQEARDALLAEIYGRANYLNGTYKMAGLITEHEEQYPSSLPERVPVAGRLFKASQVAFEGSALRMRTDLYDLLSREAQSNDVDIQDRKFIKAMGKMISSLTARAQYGRTGEGVIRIILWAPRMLVANINVLTMHGLGAGLEHSYARKQAGLNLLKIVGSIGLTLAIAAAMGADVEDDPRSTDFGKVKVGDTRFDITGGMGSLVVLAFRMISGKHKSASTGIIHEYGSDYNQRSRWDAFIDFLTNKTSPPARFVVDWLRGENWKGEKTTLAGSSYQAFTPIALQNIIELKDDRSADRVAGVILDALGISTQSFTVSEKTWEPEQSEEMRQFHDRVGKTKFEAANKAYNQLVVERFNKTKAEPKYKALSEEEKINHLARIRRFAKKDIFRRYGFRKSEAEAKRYKQGSP